MLQLSNVHLQFTLQLLIFFSAKFRAADSPQRRRDPNVSPGTARMLRHITVLVQSHKLSMLFYFMQLPCSVSSADWEKYFFLVLQRQRG